MIFTVFGNGPSPFIRLAIKIDELASKLDEEFIVQYGYTEYPFIHAQARPFYSSNQMARLIDNASLIISHGGYGTISECLKKFKKVVVVPRKKGIEVNHSQEELVRALEAEGYIIGVYDIDDLEEKVSIARYFEPKELKRGNAGEVINEFIRSIYNNR